MRKTRSHFNWVNRTALLKTSPSPSMSAAAYFNQGEHNLKTTFNSPYLFWGRIALTISWAVGALLCGLVGGKNYHSGPTRDWKWPISAQIWHIILHTFPIPHQTLKSLSVSWSLKLTICPSTTKELFNHWKAFKKRFLTGLQMPRAAHNDYINQGQWRNVDILNGNMAPPYGRLV